MLAPGAPGAVPDTRRPLDCPVEGPRAGLARVVDPMRSAIVPLVLWHEVVGARGCHASPNSRLVDRPVMDMVIVQWGVEVLPVARPGRLLLLDPLPRISPGGAWAPTPPAAPAAPGPASGTVGGGGAGARCMLDALGHPRHDWLPEVLLVAPPGAVQPRRRPRPRPRDGHPGGHQRARHLHRAPKGGGQIHHVAAPPGRRNGGGGEACRHKVLGHQHGAPERAGHRHQSGDAPAEALRLLALLCAGRSIL
mmetsp:Transcript_53106/g.168551  ORF Transcript_53106/g.168551 Transcript_53106/m.168551 type:complete len:250 (+) Transcript_53106:291-1040(+)